MRWLLLPLALLPVVLSYNNGVGRLPVMGWNTWCTDDACGLIDLCFESEIRSIADAIVAQGLDRLGYKYVNLDDCWEATTRAADGSLQAAPLQFPSGMKALADYVHSKGLKLGLYTDVGSETCKWKRPGAFNNYERDAQTLASWGIDFVKADNCHRPADDYTMYFNYSRALNSTGHPFLFSLCNWGIDDVYAWGPAVGQQYRVQMDHLPFWHWGPGAEGVGYGQGTLDIINYVADIKPPSGAFGFMDPDFLMTLFPTMPYTESRTEFSFWTLWSAPLLIATDIRNMTSELASIITNTEVIAIDQDLLSAAGERIYNTTTGAQVWSKPLENGDKAVILFNSADNETQTIGVTWEQLGWSSNSSVKVRDLWAKEDVTTTTNGFSSPVKSRDVFYFRASLMN